MEVSSRYTYLDNIITSIPTETYISVFKSRFFTKILHIDKVKLNGSIVSTNAEVVIAVVKIPTETYDGSQASTVNQAFTW